MARRRAFYPIDTSDRLANVVLSSIAILIVALLALILWMTSSPDPEATAASGQSGAAGASGEEQERVPAGVTATEVEATATPGAADGATPDRDTAGGTPGGDAAAGGTAVSPPAAATAPPGTATAPPAAATEAPTDGDLADPGSGTGLFSPDDPGRIPAITVRTSPRDEMVVTADFDGDGDDERVWSAIVRDQVVTRLEQFVEGRWRAGRDHAGAPADRLFDLRARDLTGDGLPEVYTKQWVATEGESVTLWSVDDGALQRMPVRGGCWGGNNTVGLIGASVDVPATGPARIVALCEDRTLPTQQWPSALYTWRQGGWTFEGLLGA